MAGDERVDLDEIEARLRGLGSGASSVLSSAKPRAITGGVVGGAALLALSFLLGRRRGRRRATILEIERS